MPNKRTKKRNLLTTNLELTELAYVLHISAIRLRETLSAINVPNAYRIQISRRVQWMIHQAQSLGAELQPKNPSAFLTRKSTESIGDQLGLFDS